MNIGEKIREIRVRKGFSQENMADALNMSPANYSYIEQGKVNVNIPKLEEIAKELETDIFEILSLGERNIYYIHNTEQQGGNGFIVTNQMPMDYQRVVVENEKLTNQVTFLKKQNQNSREQLRELRQIIEFWKTAATKEEGRIDEDE